MNKEAIVVILDVNPSMKKPLSTGNNQTRFQMAMESVKMLVEQKLLFSPNHELAIVLIGTKESCNYLNDQDPTQYKNVTTFRALEKLNLECFRALEEIQLEDRTQPRGDLIDGLIVAMDMIVRHCGTKKYKKRIFLITDGEKETKVDTVEFKQIVHSLNEHDTSLNVITLDFCNDLDEDEEESEAGSSSSSESDDGKGDSKGKVVYKESKSQIANRNFLVELTDQVQRGAIYPAKTAIKIYKQFKKREVSARTKYKGSFDISQSLKLAVQIFSRTREETFPSLKKQSLVADPSTSAQQGLVKIDRQYAAIDDPDQVPVPPDQQIKAFNYGKQLVPVPDQQADVLKYKQKAQNEEYLNDEDIQMQTEGGVERQFKLLGFTDQSKVPRHHFIAGVDIVLPVRGSKNERAFAAMVYAMLETHRVLIAKIIERKNAEPKLVVLYPHISKKKPVLYMVQLPTAEDIRDYQFPSLVQANPQQRQAAKQLIQALDLSKKSEDDEEKLKPELTFNPALQYFNQVVTHRIAHPEEEELPKLNDQIAQYVAPDRELFEQAAPEVSAFEEAFELHYNNEDENRKKKRVYWKDIIQQEESKMIQENQKAQEELKQQEEEAAAARLKLEQKGDGIGFKEEEIKEISSVRPIDDFRKMVGDRKRDRVAEAVGQMCGMIEKFVKNSMGGDLFVKAFECLQELRETCVREDEGAAYNTFMDKIKKIFGGQNSTYKDFWNLIVQGKISLITKKESAISSNVTDAQAEEFLKSDGLPNGRESQIQPKKKQQDDLMDEIE